MTLSTYCVEHELLARALKESERAHVTTGELAAADEALTASIEAEAHEVVQPATPL